MRRCLLGLAAVLAGCTIANPAFEGGGDGSEDTRETGTPDSSESDSAESDSSESGSSESDSTDTGSTESDSTDTDSTETGDPLSCDFGVRAPLRQGVITNAACDQSVGGLFLLLDSASFNNPEPGAAMGTKCTDATCSSCAEQGFAVGAFGFSGLADSLAALGDLADAEAVEGLCVQVAAEGLLGTQGNYCLYESMGIWEYTFEHGPIYVGNIDDAPLTWIGQQSVNGGAPVIVPELLQTCTCESVLMSLNEIQCCDAAPVEPSFYSLTYASVEVEPGMSKLLPFAQVPWLLHNIRAQSVPGCNPLDVQLSVSWALTRAQ